MGCSDRHCMLFNDVLIRRSNHEEIYFRAAVIDRRYWQLNILGLTVEMLRRLRSNDHASSANKFWQLQIHHT